MLEEYIAGNNIKAFFIGIASTYFTLQAISVFRTKNITRSRRILGYIFVVWAIYNVKDFLTTFPAFSTKESANWILFFDGWSAVTFAVFIFEITYPGWTSWKKISEMLLPFICLTIGYAFFTNEIWYIGLYVLFLVIFALSVILLGVKRARKYIEYERANYSNIDDIDISWIYAVFAFAVCSQLAWLSATLIDDIFSDIIYYIASIAIWQFVIERGINLKPIVIPDYLHSSPLTPPLHQRLTAEEDGESYRNINSENFNGQRFYRGQSNSGYIGSCIEERPSKTIALSSQSDANKNDRRFSFAVQLEQVMEEERLYLDKDLCLNDLAVRIGTNRTYLSQYFSEILCVTFYDYINSMRINKESIPLLQKHPEYTFEYIAAKSGFNSISTFRRAFTKYIGESPSSFREHIH